jgi:hypothetical protein
VVPVECEYGGDRYGRNTVLALCVAPAGGQKTSWQLLDRILPANPPDCPPTWTQAQCRQGASGDKPLACDYDEGRCAYVCTEDRFIWECRSRGDIPSQVARQPQPPVLPSCTLARPLVGSECAAEDQICYYAQYCYRAALSFGPNMKCQNGLWRIQPATVACKLVKCKGA